MGLKQVATLVAAAALAAPGPSWGGAAGAAETPADVSAADEKFLDDAYSINRGEIMLGQLAQQNAMAQAVKDYGQRMISDHSQSLGLETQAAAMVGVTLPTDVDAATHAQYDDLSRKTGRDFDTAYADAMVRGHESAVSEFGGEASMGTSAAVRAYAQHELPMLREHLRLARALVASLRQGAAGPPGPSP